MVGRLRELGVPPLGSGLRPSGLSQSSLSQAEPLVPNAWQPMRTAPRDGTRILAKASGFPVVVQWYQPFPKRPNDAGWIICGVSEPSFRDLDDSQVWPTDWAEIPESAA